MADGPGTDVKDWLHRSVGQFGDNLRAVAEDQWPAPTPNAEWDVSDLAAHVVDEHLWIPGLLAGHTVDEIADTIAAEPLGNDPVAAFEAASEAGLAAADAVDLDATVHLSFGDCPAEEYLMQLFADHLIHAWDLARATGQDEHLDPELVSTCAAWFAEREDLYREGGVIGPAVAVTDADPQEDLLARTGRDPRPS